MATIEFRTLTLIMISYSSYFANAQFDNYYNQPEIRVPVVKTELHEAGKETRIRCHIKDRFRGIRHGLNLTWHFKACNAGYAAGCLQEEVWQPLCGMPFIPCPSILTLLDPRTNDSGLYRCQITLDTSTFTPSIYMLQFVKKRRQPPVIVDDMATNVTVTTATAVLQCKVRSLVPPTVRWFRRIHQPSPPLNQQSSLNTITYFNNTYQLLNCCPIAALPQKDLYLSKLIITPGSVLESGFYICLAINDANYTFKETYVQVSPLAKASHKQAGGGSFLGLFLIPIALALIPMMAWILCIRSREVSTPDMPVSPHADNVVGPLVQPVLSSTITIESSSSSKSLSEYDKIS